jgi:chromosome segregation ATPase
MKFIPLLCLIPLLTLPLQAQETAEKAREMTTNLEKIEALIDKTAKELKEAVEQLNRIATEADKPRDAFEDFTEQLKEYKGVQATLADRIDHFRSVADTRFADWEKDLAKMQGDLKSISQARMDKAKKEYSDLDKKVRTIGAKLTKAVDKLQEVQTYFTTELNAASIQAADKVTAAAKKSAEEVTQALEDMKADYKQLRNDTSENTSKSKD